MPSAHWPPITAPWTRPGSTQAVFAAPAAKVLLGTRDGHLHAGWPGRGRGLGGSGKSEGRHRCGGSAIPGRAGRLRRLQLEPPNGIGPAGAGCWRSRGLRRERKTVGGLVPGVVGIQMPGAVMQGVGG